MPLYTYINDDTGESVDIFQGMNDNHTYSKDGKEWRRVFYSPCGIVDGKIDAWSVNKFVEKTSKPDTYGALIDRSRELSEKRAKDAGGIDPIKAKTETEYSKKRKGRKRVERIG